MTTARGWQVSIAVVSAIMLLAGCTSSDGGTRSPGQAGTSPDSNRSSSRSTDDRTTADVVDCSAFAAFLDQPAMPVGITDATCTYEGFQDAHLTAEFDLTTLSALEDWLAELPTSEPLDQERHDDVEYTQIRFSPRLDGGADYLSVSAVETADGFHVTMSAFNV